MTTNMHDFPVLELQQIELFIKQISQSPPRIEASGIFSVDMSILTTVIILLIEVIN